MRTSLALVISAVVLVVDVQVGVGRTIVTPSAGDGAAGVVWAGGF